MTGRGFGCGWRQNIEIETLIARGDAWKVDGCIDWYTQWKVLGMQLAIACHNHSAVVARHDLIYKVSNSPAYK